MSRVVRLRGATWARVEALMAAHGKGADEAVGMALDALAVFDGEAARSGETGVRGRWAGRVVLAQRELRLPVLEVLWRLGGKGEVARVRRELEEMLAGVLGEEEWRVMASGQPRWWNAVCWERLAMVKAGLLEKGARGVWVMTATGRAAYLAR